MNISIKGSFFEYYEVIKYGQALTNLSFKSPLRFIGFDHPRSIIS